MSSPMTAGEVLDREYLEIRAKILQLAASFDRLDRSGGDYRQDPRLGLIRQGLDLVANPSCPDRAEKVQLVFSREFSENWREELGLENFQS